MKASLSVFFEDPFWVGVFERIEDGKLSVCKVTFGAEPKDYDVLDFVLHHYYELAFSTAIEIETRQAADNPKRRNRNARKHLENTGQESRTILAAILKNVIVFAINVRASFPFSSPASFQIDAAHPPPVLPG